MSKKEKKAKKNCGSKSSIMVAFALTTLSTRVISAAALAVIALSFCSIKKEAKVFDECVEEIRERTQSVSDAVRFCNGG